SRRRRTRFQPRPRCPTANWKSQGRNRAAVCSRKPLYLSPLRAFHKGASNCRRQRSVCLRSGLKPRARELRNTGGRGRCESTSGRPSRSRREFQHVFLIELPFSYRLQIISRFFRSERKRFDSKSPAKRNVRRAEIRTLYVQTGMVGGDDGGVKNPPRRRL